eukprot:TRINITY_DN4477_c0_g1_i1.p1 TRINITY_DN4477_c0_g1~~TRINITY_DN4477_c0_g1_i1.p1  ORF type:complete len:482 (-),score=179.98 TRINITY_DN4477_c0_g1_i1:334-1779(-)
MSTTDERYASLKERFENANQGQVFQFWDSLEEEQQKQLLDDLEACDLEFLRMIFDKALATSGIQTTSSSEGEQGEEVIEPFPEVPKLADLDESTKQKYEQVAFEAVGAGKVAAILLAGGQGTRLGSKNPKGQYDVGLPSGKSLFQLHAERIRKVELMSGGEGVIVWYIMTSQATHQPTVDYLTDNDFFGLKKEQVYFFKQEMLPCFQKDGSLILETPFKLARAPEGNGGIYRALKLGGVLADMEQRGVEYTHVFGVDNILTTICDPIFLGYCISEENTDCAMKSVPKEYPTESVGVLGMKGGKPQIIEYSELSDEDANLRQENGDLSFRAAFICNLFCRKECLENATDKWLPDLPYHVAKKAIPQVDGEGNTFKPDEKNGIKLELFIFDIFPLCTQLSVLEVSRSSDFSPLKNAEGKEKDSPNSCRADINALHRSWVIAAGGTVQGDDDAIVEVSPMLSYAGEGLEDKCAGKVFDAPVYIE